MVARAISIGRATRPILNLMGGTPFRFVALAAAFAVLAAQSETRAILLQSLGDAYLQVSVFVAATFAAFEALKRLHGKDFGQVLARLEAWQVPIAAALGALPGCGGAVIVVSQFVQGRLTFGSLVAVLTSTMGDAAFLLLAQEPLTGLAVFSLSFLVGVISGEIVDRIHHAGFARPAPRILPAELMTARESIPRPLLITWSLVLAPGLFLGLLEALQVDAAELLSIPTALDPGVFVGPAGAILCLVVWAFAPTGGIGANACAPRSGLAVVAHGTSFVTLWVVLGYLTFDLGTHVTGFDFAGVFAAWAPVVPLLAVLVGFLPGCGPQIIVTQLYLEGVVPLSAQLGNAISNDGDALFPAIAIAPKAALLATLYSAVPAVIVAYGCYAWLG